MFSHRVIAAVMVVAGLCWGDTAKADQHEVFFGIATSQDIHRFRGLHQEVLHFGFGQLEGQASWNPSYFHFATGRMSRNGFSAARYSIGVGWRHQFRDHPHWFADLSFSPTYLTRYRFPDIEYYEDLGTRFHFTTRMAIGWEAMDDYAFEFQLEHLSNGGLGELNPGTNQVGMAVIVKL